MLLRSQMFVQSPLALLPRRWVAGRMQARLAHMPAPGSIPEPSRSRQYPEEPRVGVGVVILRNLDTSKGVEVVLIKRGTPPDMGKWSFPEVCDWLRCLKSWAICSSAKALYHATDDCRVRYSRGSRGNRAAAAQRHKPGGLQNRRSANFHQRMRMRAPGAAPPLHGCRRHTPRPKYRKNTMALRNY